MNDRNGTHLMTRLQSHGWLRAGLLASALAFACNAQAAKNTAPDVATDPAGAWTHFLANANGSDAYRAYAALDAVGYDGTVVDAALCRQEAAQLRASVATVPVSVALHRAAMLCAEATGDAAAAEREMLAIAALAKLAFGGAVESENARPIRVLRPHDIRALNVAAGLEPRYAYFPWWRTKRTFPIVAAAWDPERKVERHLTFDFIDATVAAFREPQSKYPSYRNDVARTVMQALREANVPEAVDWMAWKEGRALTDSTSKVAKFRMGAEVGGVQSARTWILWCSEEGAAAQCADGLVDTLLPQAEQKNAFATLMLAYAYANGIGIARDEATATQLLDAAEAQWPAAGVAYAKLWNEAQAGKPLPDAMMRRLERAEGAGIADARFLRLSMRLDAEPTAPLDATDIAFLSAPAQNTLGYGYAMLANWSEARKADADHKRYRKLAADAGHPAAQADEGFWLAFAEVGPKDVPAGRKYLEQSAQAGNGFGARAMAWVASDANDHASAEKWLFDSWIQGYDADAMLDLAFLYEWEYAGVTGKPDGAIAIYENLAANDIAEARRRLARMAMQGRGMPKDEQKAVKLLEADAIKGDHDSESLLGILLLGDTGTPKEEAAGVRWIERAIAGGNQDASAQYGQWLFYRKATDASRAKAVDVWRTGMKNKDDGAANNFAWMLCTARVDAFRDAKEGMEAVREMGDVDALNWGYQDTVAACRAASGDFAGAVSLQKRVLDAWLASLEGQPANADRDKQTKELKDRLALYEAGKVYIQPEDEQG